MHRHDGAAAAKLVVARAKEDLPDAQQRQCARTHDARLNRDVQLAPAAQQQHERINREPQDSTVKDTRSTIQGCSSCDGTGSAAGV